MELLFKTISKAFQSLVQDLTPDEIERMMWSLKQEKEELVRYRAVIPQKMYLTTQVCRIGVLLYIKMTCFQQNNLMQKIFTVLQFN